MGKREKMFIHFFQHSLLNHKNVFFTFFLRDGVRMFCTIYSNVFGENLPHEPQTIRLNLTRLSDFCWFCFIFFLLLQQFLW